MPYPAQYAPPQRNPPANFGYKPIDQTGGGEYGQRFAPKKKVNDAFFLILFLAQVSAPCG